jgi:putative membrane protein
MERSNNKINTSAILFIYIYFLAGVLWHFLDFSRAIVLSLTPYTLFLTSILVIYFGNKKIEIKLTSWLFGTFIFTMLIEILGVKSGIIFGNYSYGSILGLKYYGVPIVIGLNWTIVIYGLYTISNKIISQNIFLKSFLVGVMAVLFDLILEPVAVKLSYWNWQSASIPIQNYLSWFLISACISFIGAKVKINIDNTLIKHYLFAQYLFFFFLLVFI